MTDKKAIVLLSGGIDSSTCLAIARAEGFAPYCLSFRYGQRHTTELSAATEIAEAHGAVEHRVVDIDLGSFGGSALVTGIAVPKHDFVDEIDTDDIPITYVPARNTVFLSFALAWCEVLECTDVFIGVNALDYSGYPDCRPEFIEAFEKMSNVATKIGGGESPIRIRTPLIDLTKGQIIKRGLELDVNYGVTRTCYDPDEAGAACGHCDACLLRIKGFEENDLTDPAPYQRA